MPYTIADLKVGFAYMWQAPGSPKEHLHFILAESRVTPDLCVLVNVTEGVGGEAAYKVPTGYHEYIVKDSEINFGDGIIASKQDILAEINSKAVDPVRKAFTIDQLRPIGLVAKTKESLFPRKAIDMLKARWIQ